MVKARVLVSHAHGEEIPEKFLASLEKADIAYDISQNPLTGNFDGYSCLAFFNPKTSVSEEERAAIARYKENDGGILITYEFYSEQDYEERYDRAFIRLLFDADLIAKRVLPKLDIGTHKLEYFKEERSESFFGGQTKKVYINLKKAVEVDGKEISRMIVCASHSPLTWVDNIKLKINESYVPVISSFSGCKEDKTILRREFQVKMEDDEDEEEACKELFSEYDGESRDDGYYSLDPDGLGDILNKEFKKHVNVGIINDLSKKGRVIGIASNELIKQIENEEHLSGISQKFLRNGIIWASEPLRYRIKPVTSEKAKDVKPPEIKRAENIPVLSKEQRGQLEAFPNTTLYWKSMFHTAYIGYLMEKGTMGEILSEMKIAGEIIEGGGNPENFGSDILSIYQKFDMERPPSNLRMEEFLVVKPGLVSFKEDLHTLIRKAIDHYKNEMSA